MITTRDLSTRGIPSRALFSLLFLALLIVPVGPFGGPRTASAEDLEISLGEEDVLIEDFLRTVSKITGRTLIWNPADKNIRGKKIIGGVSFHSSETEFFGLVRSLLTFYELVIIPVGPEGAQVYLVADARQTSSILKLKPEHIQLEPKNLSFYEHADGLFVTTTIPVKHMEDLRNARNALTRIVTGANIGNVTEVPGANAFVVTDFAPNVVSIYRLLMEMDVPSANSSTTSGRTVSIALEYAHAEEVASILVEHFSAGPSPASAQRNAAGVPGPRAPRITGDERTNKILVTGDDEQITKVKEVVQMIDVPVQRASVSAHYVRLKNASANEMAVALNAFIQTSLELWVDGPIPSVVAHRETNGLLISAGRSGFEHLQRLISEMDAPKPEK